MDKWLDDREGNMAKNLQRAIALARKRNTRRKVLALVNNKATPIDPALLGQLDSLRNRVLSGEVVVLASVGVTNAGPHLYASHMRWPDLNAGIDLLKRHLLTLIDDSRPPVD